jgi:hypothetical protein
MKAVAVMQDIHHYLPVLVVGPRDLVDKGAERWLAEHDDVGRDVWDYLTVQKLLYDLEEETREAADVRAAEYAQSHSLPFLRL